MTSNAENEKRGELAGRVDGQCWAEHTTEHDDLRRVAAAIRLSATPSTPTTSSRKWN
jgi:hypothetical protein